MWMSPWLTSRSSASMFRRTTRCGAEDRLPVGQRDLAADARVEPACRAPCGSPPRPGRAGGGRGRPRRAAPTSQRAYASIEPRPWASASQCRNSALGVELPLERGSAAARAPSRLRAVLLPPLVPASAGPRGRPRRSPGGPRARRPRGASRPAGATAMSVRERAIGVLEAERVERRRSRGARRMPSMVRARRGRRRPRRSARGAAACPPSRRASAASSSWSGLCQKQKRLVAQRAGAAGPPVGPGRGAGRVTTNDYLCWSRGSGYATRSAHRAGPVRPPARRCPIGVIAPPRLASRRRRSE